jgi:hypothetical protein
MIQEHLYKRLLRKIYSNQELGNLKRFPVKDFNARATILGSVLEKSTISGVSGIK